MTIPSLIRAELARLTATPLARLAFIALMIVPLLYGGAYLWANRDPYAKLDQVPAAIVDQDAGATLDGERVDYGKDVTKQALDGADFKWTETSAADARSGVRNGTYDFVVTIPHDFSESLVSAQGDDPKRAELVMTTADTNSYLASTIAEQAGKTMRTAVAERVGKQAAKTLLVGLADVRDSLGDAVDGAGQLASGATSAADGARQLASGTDQLSAGASQLASGTAELPSQTRQLADGAGQVASGASSLASGLADAQRQTADLPAQTQQLAGGAKQVSDNLTALTAETDPALQALQTASPDTVTAAITQAAADRGVTLTPEQQAVVAATVQAQLQDEKTQQQLADAKAALQGLDQLRDGSQQVTDGAAQLAAAAPTLSNGIASAASGRRSCRPARRRSRPVRRSSPTPRPRCPRVRRRSPPVPRRPRPVRRRCRPGWTSSRAARRSSRRSSAQGRTKIPASTASQRNAQASVISDPVKVGDDNVPPRRTTVPASRAVLHLARGLDRHVRAVPDPQADLEAGDHGGAEAPVGGARRLADAGAPRGGADGGAVPDRGVSRSTSTWCTPGRRWA